MIYYDYHCAACGTDFERAVPYEYRDMATCECGAIAQRLLSAPRVKNPAQGGADRFTAEALGIPVNELPSGLKTKN
jgi:putative FmdB family regulatory protein